MRFVIDETPDKMKSSCMYGIFYLKNNILRLPSVCRGALERLPLEKNACK